MKAFRHPSELHLVGASDQQQEAMSMMPSGLMVSRGKGTAGSEAAAEISLQVKMRNEPSCDSMKDAGSVFLFSICHNNYYLLVSS